MDARSKYASAFPLLLFGVLVVLSPVASAPPALAASAPLASLGYDSIELVEAVPNPGVRRNCVSNFSAPENAHAWWIARPNAPDSVRWAAADRAVALLGSAYDLQWPSPTPKGPVYTCVGLVEWVYEQSGVNLTSSTDELDGTWPYFYPDEQFASTNLTVLGNIPAADIRKGDIIYRNTFGVDVIPGVQDHVGIVINDGTAALSEPRVQAVCAPYNFSSGPENCTDKVDNDLDGYIDQVDPDCSPPPSPSAPGLSSIGLGVLVLLLGMAGLFGRNRSNPA